MTDKLKRNQLVLLINFHNQNNKHLQPIVYRYDNPWYTLQHNGVVYIKLSLAAAIQMAHLIIATAKEVARWKGQAGFWQNEYETMQALADKATLPAKKSGIMGMFKRLGNTN